METCLHSAREESGLRFKPTYKEWKHIPSVGIDEQEFCFKPTYKEWKRGGRVEPFSSEEPF